MCPRRVPPAASGRRVDGRGVRAAKQRVLIEVGRQRDEPLGPVRGLVPGAYPVVGQHSSHAGREELPPRLERHRRRAGRRRRVLCGLRRGEVPGGRRQFVAPEQDRAQPCPQHRAAGVVKVLAAKLGAQRGQRLLRLAVPRQALGGDHLRHGARDTGAGSRRGAACPGRGLRGPAPGEQQQRELAGRRRRVLPADGRLAAGASAAGPPGSGEAGVRQPAPRGPRIAGRDGETAEHQAARGRRRRRGYLVGEAARRRGLAEVEKQPGGRLEQAIAFRAAGGDAERREVQVAGLGQPARRPVSLGVPGQLPRERGVRPPARRDPVGQRLRAGCAAGRLPVQRRTLGDADAAVDGGANAGVRELTAPAVDGGRLGEQARPDGLVERGQRIGQVRERRGVGQAAPGTEHGGGGNQAPGRPRAAGQPGQHPGLERLGRRQQQVRRRQRRAQRFARHGLQDLPDILRHAAGVLKQPPRGAGRNRAGADPFGQRPDLGDPQPGDFQPCPAVADEPHQPRRQAAELVITHGQQGEQRGVRQPPQRVAQRAQRQRVSPLRVIDDKHRARHP